MAVYYNNLFKIFCTAMVGLPISVDATSLKLNQNVRVRQASNNVLQSVGSLKPGTVVKIPDEVIEQITLEKKDPSKEFVVFDWLKRNGELLQFQSSNGVIKKDFFYPVEVVDPGKSTGVEAGITAYVPIRYLLERDGLEFVVKEEMALISKKEYQRIKRAMSLLTNAMDRTLAKIDEESVRNVENRRALPKYKFSLKKSCPINLATFSGFVANVSQRYNIPQEILFSIVQMESSGDCFARRKENDGTYSVGLFQVNTQSTSILECNKWQRGQIRRIGSVKELKNPALKCLENPLINLEVAATVLRQKYAYVNNRNTPSSHRWNIMEKQARDDWRKALAAYSGGQAYVFQAYYDIRDYTQKTGILLDPDDWETRRLFFFRNLLKKSEQENMFDDPVKYERNVESTYINIIYVESIAGRENKPIFKQKSIISNWLVKLYYSNKNMIMADNSPEETATELDN